MTTGPELRDDLGNLVPAVAAVGLFVVMAAVFVGAPIGDAQGIPENAEVTNESLGDASLQENASIETRNGSTVAVVQGPNGNETTTLADEEGVNASLVTSGGQLYAVVSEQVSVTESIGYAMFGLTDQLPEGLQSENFLAVFEIIDLVLVAALVGAVMLARREGPAAVVELFGTTGDETTAEGPVSMFTDGGSEEDASTDGGDA